MGNTKTPESTETISGCPRRERVFPCSLPGEEVFVTAAGGLSFYKEKLYLIENN